MSTEKDTTTTVVETADATVTVQTSGTTGKVKEPLVEGSKLQVRVRNLADEIKQSVSKDDVGNSTSEGAVYTTYMDRNGLSKDQLEKKEDLDAVFFAASKLANAELGLDQFAADKNLDKFTTKIPTVGDSYVHASIKRSQVIGGRTVYGATSFSHEVVGARGVGQMAVVKDIISNQANAALANV